MTFKSIPSVHHATQTTQEIKYFYIHENPDYKVTKTIISTLTQTN